MIPQRTKDGLDRWAEQGIPTGDFLYAVLTNDLFEAMGRADEENARCLRDICIYIYNELPAMCWGDRKRVEEWPDVIKTEKFLTEGMQIGTFNV